MPDIKDVVLLIQLLEGLGVIVEKTASNTYSFQASEVNLDYFYSPEFVSNASRIRGSVMLIGPLLARFGKAVLPKPGGDKIGRRRIDTHLLGLQKLGAIFNYDSENSLYSIKAPDLKGAYILMDEISVTGDS